MSLFPAITRPAAVAAGLSVAAATLIGCSSHDPAEEEIVYVTVTSTNPGKKSSSNKQVPQEEPSTVVVTVTEEQKPPQQIPGGDPDGIPPLSGAGGPKPPQARSATHIIPTANDVSKKMAAVQNADGTVVCGLFPDSTESGGRFFGCQIPTLMRTMKYGREEFPPSVRPPRWFVPATEGGTTEIVGVTDVPNSMNANPGNSQVINDGEVVTFGDNVCAGNHGGLTCWVIGSGHGADMADNYFRSF
ncbi:hypothetical protein ACFSSC_06445 [Corynebacterium mendelii]|uniref:Secreted protein n=1 Tax=Corynebacterium mendelii TaxID=2765362 RepID=A0A939IVU8_9CORY|nr:hypothetical protein [Corynebacterium mendelii]MBN9644616.1 hypothetical protein [Corynebacterium mendelii]